MNKIISKEEAKIYIKNAGFNNEPIDKVIDKIYDSFEQNKLITTKQNIANLATYLEEDKEYEITIKEVVAN